MTRHATRGTPSPARPFGPEGKRGGSRRRRKRRNRRPRPASDDPVPVFEALRAALPRWLRMGVSPWVSDTVEHGVKIVWTATPTPFNSAEYPLAAADHEFMATEIQRELDARYIKEVTRPDDLDALVCIASAFVTNQAKKPRKVLDGIDVRDF